MLNTSTNQNLIPVTATKLMSGYDDDVSQHKQILLDIDNTIYKGFLIADLAELVLNKWPSSCTKKQLDAAIADYLVEVPGAGKNLLNIFGGMIAGRTNEELLLLAYELILANVGKFQTKIIDFVAGIGNSDIVLATGEPTFVARAVWYFLQSKFGLHITGIEATVFETNSGLFTGNVSKYYDKAAAADRALGSFVPQDVIAIGDHNDDIKMMEKTGIAIGVNPSKGLTDWLTGRTGSTILYTI